MTEEESKKPLSKAEKQYAKEFQERCDAEE